MIILRLQMCFLGIEVKKMALIRMPKTIKWGLFIRSSLMDYRKIMVSEISL